MNGGQFFLAPRPVILFALGCALLGCGQTNQTPAPLTQQVSIVSQPASTTVPLGATATMTVSATGTAPLNYQWSRDSVPIAGATSSSYTTLPIQSSDNGAAFTVTVSNAIGSVTSSSAIITVGARAPKTGDMRFQLVDFWADNELNGQDSSGDLLTYQESKYADAIGSQLEIGDETCSASSGSETCAWPYWVNGLAPEKTGLILNYKSGLDSNFDSDLNTLNTQNSVILCLDLQPSAGVYGTEWVQTSNGGGFDLIRRVVAPNNLASVVAQDGLGSRVITAVSFDLSGQANLMSYGWQGDAATQYDTQVSVVAPQDIGSAASNLAAAGFIITAFGGDDSNGYVLIGTKVHGDSMSRPFQVVDASQQSGQVLAGSSPVGRVLWNLGSSNQGNIFMVER